MSHAWKENGFSSSPLESGFALEPPPAPGIVGNSVGIIPTPHLSSAPKSSLQPCPTPWGHGDIPQSAKIPRKKPMSDGRSLCIFSRAQGRQLRRKSKIWSHEQSEPWLLQSLQQVLPMR